MTSVWPLAGLLALVFANGFFVAAEFAIVTVRKTRVDQLIAEGHHGARAVRRAVTAPDRYIAATQLGITMASLGLGWMGEPALAALIEPAFAFLPVSIAAATAHSIAFAIAFTFITGIEIVFGELTPKMDRARTGGEPRRCGRQAAGSSSCALLAVHPRAARHGPGRSCGCSACTATIATRWSTPKKS